jgi:hypothetical protein
MRQALLDMPSSMPPTAQVIENEAETVSNARCLVFCFLWARARGAEHQPTAATGDNVVVEAKLALV